MSKRTVIGGYLRNDITKFEIVINSPTGRIHLAIDPDLLDGETEEERLQQFRDFALEKNIGEQVEVYLNDLGQFEMIQSRLPSSTLSRTQGSPVNESLATVLFAGDPEESTSPFTPESNESQNESEDTSEMLKSPRVKTLSKAKVATTSPSAPTEAPPEKPAEAQAEVAEKPAIAEQTPAEPELEINNSPIASPTPAPERFQPIAEEADQDPEQVQVKPLLESPTPAAPATVSNDYALRETSVRYACSSSLTSPDEIFQLVERIYQYLSK